MQFGVQLPTYWRDYGESTVKQAIEEAAKAAADLGYASVWANDHVIAAQARRGAVGHLIEPLITLASLVNLVPQVQLGTSVLVLPQRHAVVVAKQAAALHVLSGGRLILGLGVGWNEPEFRFLNADFDQRGRVANEAIEVMRTLWRDAATVDYQGEFYNFADAVFFPKPPRGGPPLWIGGNSAPALRRAARYGDAWCPYGIDLDAFRVGVATLRAQQPARPQTMAAHLMFRIQADGDGGEADGAHVAGSTGKIVETLAQYGEAGLDYLVCGFIAHGLNDFLDQVQRFTEQIVPHFQDA